MALLTFVITNNSHHYAMMRPLAQQMAARGHRIRFVSFCEFRGLRTPLAELEADGFTVRRVPPMKIRPSPKATEGVLAVVAPNSRSHLYTLFWHGLLRHFARVGQADLVIVPNDSVFPCNYLCERLKRQGMPFLLIQEGIRFPLPCEEKVAYGTAGGDVACWGEGSADYFASVGAARERLHVTGNPRYDPIVRADWKAEAEQLRQRGLLPERYMLFATNPVNTQGLCSEQAKLESFSRFVEQALPVLEEAGLTLAVKLHGSELEESYRAAIGPLASQVRFLREGGIHAVLAGCEALVIWASTVGLEGLLHGASLAVLETPGNGHVFDYVERGAAFPLFAGEPLAPQLRAWLAPDEVRRKAGAAHVDRHLACRGEAVPRTVDLIESLLLRRRAA